MIDKYILEGHTPVPVHDSLTWARWFETADRTVAMTKAGGGEVSTVFLGIDHRFTGDGPPLLFETIIFGVDGRGDGQWRCSTWDEALAQHAVAVESAKVGEP